MLLGTKDQRSRALLRKADVYLTNYENLRWLAETVQTYFVSKGRQAPFDGIVFDEISKCKNSSTNRVKAFLKIKDQFKWSTGLTGTPAANGYADLHGQYLVLDGGKRLGTSKTAFKNRFYYKSGPYKYKPYDNTQSEIESLIGDITLQMSAEDYNPLPDMVVNDVMVDLEPEIRAKYDTLERDFFFYLDSGEGVEVFNAASLTNKCIAEGTEILTEKGWIKIEKYQGERVWDGDEWVNTDGLIDQGYKNTVLCWGVHMTPDHKVFTNQGWRTAEEILDGESCKRYDRYEVRIPNGFGESREQTNKQDIEGCGCIRVVWRKTTVTSRKRVFDIVNAGPRRRFTVRGKDGQIFISHNCLQLSNGAVYPIPGMSLWEAVHDQKLDALEDIIEEANGQQILCAYAYRSDAERIMQRFKHLRPINLTECKSEASLRGAMARWKDGDCPLMIGHPASMGHGVDGLQDAGHIIVWFGLNWSLDLYEQFNARVRRQGQGVPVICHRILTQNTLDQAQMEALDEKATTQNALRAAVKRYRDGKR